MSFNDPVFLRCVIKYGLLKGTATPEDAYMLMGKLLQSETLRLKRLALMGDKPGIAGIVEGIEALNPTELLNVRELVAGVVPFKKGGSK
jgi:hypothetical protein